jgi:class 3 adenylate cyclase
MEPPPPEPALIDELSGNRMEVGDSFTIGRSPGADLVIDSERVSRKHALIRREGDGFLFYDLKSANGSWIDDRQVDQPVSLHEGSRVRIDSHRFTFHAGAGEDSSSRDSPDFRGTTLVGIDREPMVFMVVDLHGFTSLVEGLEERQVAEMLAPWYERCREQIESTGGTIDKFIGDSVFARWRGTGINTRAAALRCARAMVTSLEGLKGFEGGSCGVALHVGTAAVGSLGRSTRTALGEAVNLTFRVEALTRPLGRKLLVTSTFLEGWDAGARQFASLGSHAVKGFSAEVEVFGLPAS